MKYAGVILFFLGVALVGLSFYTSDQVKQETKAAYQATEVISENPIIEMGGPQVQETGKKIGSAMNEKIGAKAAPYETMASYALTLGVVFIALGIVIALFYVVRKRH
jgi:hypothetical protein